MDAFVKTPVSGLLSALALNDAGQILALNTAASQLFELASGDGMRALGIERKAFE